MKLLRIKQVLLFNLENMPRKFSFKRLFSDDSFDMYEGVYELSGFGTYLAALSPIWRKAESTDFETGSTSLCLRIFYNIQTKNWELHEGDDTFTTTHLSCSKGLFQRKPFYYSWTSSIRNTKTIYKIEEL